jgi:mannose/cellobiose epimerase-like protein (N-acyl-D-glucosamine 2-epimerase family)
MIPAAPNFHRRQTILDHVRHTLDFYRPRAIDASGGCYHFFSNDGSVYDARTRHLVSSTRFVFLWSMASRHFGDPADLRKAQHALRFLRDVHRNPDSGGYAWQLHWDNARATVLDATNHCYGLAFVALAYAHAAMAGITEARPWLDETFDLLERRFWSPEHRLYADEAAPTWELSRYRGQNANMHATEACLAAWEATRDLRYLDRAATLAESVAVRLAAQSGGRIWEHYQEDWSIDPDYNRGDDGNIFRPWGFQPGHFTEWSKLLLTLERHRPMDWLLPRAEALFDDALAHAWDTEHGGLHYGFAPDGSICFPDKYHWVQCETLAAAAMLGARTGKRVYWDWYDRLWAYCWTHWVDHRHGAWFRILTPDNRNLTDQKSPAGKVDYHTTGACYDILSTLSG